MPDSESSKSNSVDLAFGTPLLKLAVSRAEALNRELIDRVRTLEQASMADAGEPGLSRRSGIGGWRTGDDFLEDTSDAVRELRGAIEGGLRHMLSLGTPATERCRLTRLFGWANLNRSSDYNVIHSHPRCDWSGVYYVSTNTPEGNSPAAGSNALGGVIEFQDPRGAANAAPFPGFDFGRKVRIVPQPGLMLIFPSWLLHMVHPFDGPGERITVAFNAVYEV